MDPRLIIFSLALGLLGIAVYVPITFLPDAMVKEHGISHIKAGNIVAFYGISSIVGPIICGVAANYLKNSAVLLISLLMFVLGWCCVGMAYSVLYWQFVVCSCIYGICTRGILGLLPISLIDMFGIESLKVSYSVIMICCTISSLVGPPMAGRLKMLWGNYDIAFIITSGLYFLGSIFTFIIMWIHKRNNISTYTDSAQYQKQRGYNSTSAVSLNR